MKLGIVGNPENRRVVDFLETVRAAGDPAPAVLAWEAVLTEHDAIERFAAAVDVIRLESPGQNAAVATGLIRLGGGPAEPLLGHGEIGFLREVHRGFVRLLERFAATGAKFLNHPEDVAAMFDKWESHQRFAAAGLPRPASAMAPDSAAAWRETMARERAGRVFLKPLHGSSASGVCAFRWTPTREQLIAPIGIRREPARTVLYNTRKVRSYDRQDDIDTVLGPLLPAGMIREEWILKAELEGGRCDLRVVTIAGKARHWVVRQGRSPMTNLHLGNRRGDPEAFRSAFGDAVVDECLRLAERAAGCFPRSLYAGVDILVDRRGRAFVGEINAFGDLLPGLTDKGETTYEAIYRAIREVHA